MELSSLIFAMILIVVVIAVVALAGGPSYNVWAAEMHGKAQLAEAEYAKQVAVQTSKAKFDSAQYEADAEVRRAEGVAKANKIIGDSLQNNEIYLRYLWINGLNERQGDREIVYVPTEANLPILEAGKTGGNVK